MASHPQGEIACRQMCLPGEWQGSKLAIQKALHRTRWFATLFLGTPVPRRVTQSASHTVKVGKAQRTRYEQLARTQWQKLRGKPRGLGGWQLKPPGGAIEEADGWKRFRSRPGPRVVTHSTHPRGGGSNLRFTRQRQGRASRDFLWALLITRLIID